MNDKKLTEIQNKWREKRKEHPHLSSGEWLISEFLGDLSQIEKFISPAHGEVATLDTIRKTFSDASNTFLLEHQHDGMSKTAMHDARFDAGMAAVYALQITIAKKDPDVKAVRDAIKALNKWDMVEHRTFTPEGPTFSAEMGIFNGVGRFVLLDDVLAALKSTPTDAVNTAELSTKSVVRDSGSNPEWKPKIGELVTVRGKGQVNIGVYIGNKMAGKLSGTSADEEVVQIASNAWLVGCEQGIEPFDEETIKKEWGILGPEEGI